MYTLIITTKFMVQADEIFSVAEQAQRRKNKDMENKNNESDHKNKSGLLQPIT